MLNENVKIGELRELYEQGLSGGEISERVGLTAGCIRERLRRAGFRLRSQEEAMRLAVARGRYNRDRSGENNSSWKGGRFLTSDGYWKVYKPGHHRAVDAHVLEHILIWEEANHKELPDDWLIHHLNGIKGDNRPENLMAMTRSGHSRKEWGDILKKRIRELEKELAGSGTRRTYGNNRPRRLERVEADRRYAGQDRDQVGYWYEANLRLFR